MIYRKQQMLVIGLSALLPVLGLSSTVDFNQIQLKNIDSNSVENISSQDSETYIRGLKIFQDDSYPNLKINDIKLTQHEKNQAIVWGLSNDQEKRYVLLMKNRSGLYWKGSKLSPVEILGINSRNPEERKQYAILYAKQLQARQAKELAWQVAATQAKLRVNKGLPLIRPFEVSSFSPYNYHAVDLKSGDTLFMMTKLNLNVRRVVSTLLSEIKNKSNVSFNIFFAGSPSIQSIQDWAKNQSIPVDLVKQRVITINSDEGPFKNLGSNKKAPILILARDGHVTRIDMSRF